MEEEDEQGDGARAATPEGEAFLGPFLFEVEEEATPA